MQQRACKTNTKQHDKGDNNQENTRSTVGCGTQYKGQYRQQHTGNGHAEGADSAGDARKRR
ncbi:Uncharacterised protein [Pseudescherichia vulneris]|nr:Uncharacterised protein [Pseudescherichia vulneris]